MLRPLPYPGHTWSFTQHAAGFNAKTVYDFLKCVAPFESDMAGYRHKITALMIASGVLTPNERDGTPDAWRDYQQLLVELGLLYSTKICPALTITELGQMFLAGEIGFSELVGIQALRYQYPNGQKSTIQGRLRSELEGMPTAVPETLIELQVNSQVLIKPGLLILRVLLELYEAGQEPFLSVDECQAYLLPCKKNAEWPLAMSEVIANRSSPEEIAWINRHSRRNIQDWFKFLGESDFFHRDGLRLYLTAFALTNIDLLKRQCDIEEDGASFWIPTSFDIPSRIEWFSWFGHIPFSSQALLRPDVTGETDYVTKNFVAGVDDNLEDDTVTSADDLVLNLQPLDLVYLGRNTSLNLSTDMDALVGALQRGAQKRHAKTLLHDRIIKQLAERFIAQGATVHADRDSIDLLSTWPDGSSAIFEVKTVTRHSFQSRLRTAIGQVQEYAYRRLCDGNGPSDRVIVVNADIKQDAWQRAFLTEHLDIGLVCTTATSYSAYGSTSSQSQQYWVR